MHNWDSKLWFNTLCVVGNKSSPLCFSDPQTVPVSPDPESCYFLAYQKWTNKKPAKDLTSLKIIHTLKMEWGEIPHLFKMFLELLKNSNLQNSW